jgi:hypothetical protein
MRWEQEGTYADRRAVVRNRVSYDYVHSMGEVLTALIAAGLQIEYLHEFPYCVCGMLPCMEQDPDGWWRLKGRQDLVPFLFSVKATKVGVPPAGEPSPVRGRVTATVNP